MSTHSPSPVDDRPTEALTDEFARLFRTEHRAVRDVLLDLLEAFQARNRAAINFGLARCAELTGPHFRYEEERMYPALVKIFGPEYIEAQYHAHDGAIAAARGLVALAGQETLSDDDLAEARRLLLVLLPHVSDCEGLSIMVERLPESDVRAILDARERSWREGLNLLDWASTVRTRPAAARV